MNPAEKITALEMKRDALESQLVVGMDKDREVAIRHQIASIGQEITALYGLLTPVSDGTTLADVWVAVQQLSTFMEPVFCQLLLPVATSKESTVLRPVKENMLKFYQTENCIVMRQVFLGGTDTKGDWGGHWMATFPPVHAHIVPQSNAATLQLLGISVDDPRDALPLFKHIEVEWDRGNIAIVPVAGTSETSTAMVVRIEVAQSIQDQPICFTDKHGRIAFKQPVKNVTFRELHGKTVSFGENKPYVRCLLLRWGTSYKKNPEFTEPDSAILKLCKRDPQHIANIAKLVTKCMQGVVESPDSLIEAPADHILTVPKGKRRKTGEH